LADIVVLDDLLSTQSLQFESEEALLTLILQLEPNSIFLSHHIRPEYLSSTGISTLFEFFTNSNPTDPLWDRFVLNFAILDSAIVPKFSTSLGWNRDQIFLLYRGSCDGFKSSDFHRNCDGHGPTVILIETTKGYIFGGYTPIHWDSSNRYKIDESGTSFLFSLKSPSTTGLLKFGLKTEGKRHAICCDQNYGPRFGYDISIGNLCNTGDFSHASYFGSTYQPTLNFTARTFFTGSPNFTVKEIEVFEIQ
jgi:hypothetical protein